MHPEREECGVLHPLQKICRLGFSRPVRVCVCLRFDLMGSSDLQNIQKEKKSLRAAGERMSASVKRLTTCRAGRSSLF